MINLTKTQQFVLLLLQENASHSFLYKKKNITAIFSIGIWELFQAKAVNIKNRRIVPCASNSEGDLQYEYQRKLFQLIHDTNPQSMSYLIEKHVVYRSKYLKDSLKAIIDSLIECGYITTSNKKHFGKPIYSFILTDIRIDDEMKQIIDYMLYRRYYKKKNSKKVTINFTIDRHLREYLDKFFDEYRYNKLEWIIIALISFFTGD